MAASRMSVSRRAWIAGAMTASCLGTRPAARPGGGNQVAGRAMLALRAEAIRLSALAQEARARLYTQIGQFNVAPSDRPTISSRTEAAMSDMSVAAPGRSAATLSARRQTASHTALTSSGLSDPFAIKLRVISVAKTITAIFKFSAARIAAVSAIVCMASAKVRASSESIARPIGNVCRPMVAGTAGPCKGPAGFRPSHLIAPAEARQGLPVAIAVGAAS